MLSIYERAKAAGIKYGRDSDCGMDSHESDLYLKDTPEARRIVQEWQAETGRDGFITYFHSQIDGAQWMDIPFAFDPFWTAARVRDRRLMSEQPTRRART